MTTCGCGFPVGRQAGRHSYTETYESDLEVLHKGCTGFDTDTTS